MTFEYKEYLFKIFEMIKKNSDLKDKINLNFKITFYLLLIFYYGNIHLFS